LIVDEAWVPTCPFHEGVAITKDAGADACMVSVHKMGAGFAGTVFHRNTSSAGSAQPAPTYCDHQPQRAGVLGAGRLAPNGRAWARCSAPH
jgi:hypothetical protein